MSDTSKADKAADSGLRLTTCSPSLDSLKGLKGSEYGKAWAKLNNAKMREAGKRWRENHPEKVKAISKRRYQEGRTGIKKLRQDAKKDGRERQCHSRYYSGAEKAKWKGEPWGVVEECMVMERKMTDHELAEELGRSVRAIQIKRCKLNKQNLLENV